MVTRPAWVLDTGALIAYAAGVGWLATWGSMPKVFASIVVAGNTAWTAASIALLFSGWVAPNLLGEATVAMQAIAVGIFAELQYAGLRRSAHALAA